MDPISADISRQKLLVRSLLMPYAKVPHDQFCFILISHNTFMVASVADRMNNSSSGEYNVIKISGCDRRGTSSNRQTMQNSNR
jgi:ABC-type dipeptide/oligopeptide/nickel transport system ATPase subunit